MSPWINNVIDSSNLRMNQFWEAISLILKHSSGEGDSHIHDGQVLEFFFNPLLQIVSFPNWVCIVGSKLVSNQYWPNVPRALGGINIDLISSSLGEIFNLSWKGKEDKMMETWNLFKSCVTYDDYAPMNIFYSNNEDLFEEDHKQKILDFFSGLATNVVKFN
ncbi:hypothetical protein SUGI_0056750 [Cryptomeria japonica]|nr:hypothetical protein SUGI_0056750 [Cryptomeria japonica]